MVNLSQNVSVQTLERELDWLTEVINVRLKRYFNQPTPYLEVSELPLPALEQNDPYAHLVSSLRLTFADRLVLILALAPYLRPHLLDVFYLKNRDTDQRFTEFGCVKANQFGGLLPTLETLLFLLAGNDLENRLYYLSYFLHQYILFKQQWLRCKPIPNEPPTSALLLPTTELTVWMTTGQEYAPEFSTNFPAKRIKTKYEWNDLVLPASTLKQLNEILAWVQYGSQLLDDWEMRRTLMPGYRCLFFGPSGTGKSLTAALLGKVTGREVYKIDLSMVVSKFIGETEKNLSEIFNRAENKDWILFFDEADALFGKRTDVKDSHDRYANQEVSFLLQRVEDFSGIVILASNFKSNIDDAFIRRFQTVVHFPIPKPAQRLQLWQNAFSARAQLAANVNLQEIAQHYELTGGAIVNVVRYCSLMAVSQGTTTIQLVDIEEGIRKEFLKEGKTM
ncbi:MAG: ATP-binding protein [Spirosomataceae bacterium]